MKIIVFLVLAGLSLAAPGITDTNPDTRWKYMSDELKQFPDLMQKFRTFTCNYKGKFDDNAANFENFFNALKSTSGQVGCLADTLLGTNGTIEQTAEGASDALKYTDKVGGEFIDGLGLSPTVAYALCQLTLTPATILKLDDLYCKNDFTALSAYDLFESLQNIGFFADDALGTKETVEELFKKFGDTLAPPLQKIVRSTAGALQDKVPAGVLGCSLRNIASGGTGGGIVGEGTEGGILPWKSL
ncbi:uncharacterized protein ACNLHF_027346 isoform 4-T4 [Anomaloglossus baeobatrachus]|uniref:uncharacterized protein LOC142249404 isoform X2 n=1 Tax=Anomaloglossus baeobatrachus TaxID=238106 RepID=UPI003F4F4529